MLLFSALLLLRLVSGTMLLLLLSMLLLLLVLLLLLSTLLLSQPLEAPAARTAHEKGLERGRQATASSAHAESTWTEGSGVEPACILHRLQTRGHHQVRLARRCPSPRNH